MPYVKRNNDGEVVGIFRHKQYRNQEFIDGDVQLLDVKDYKQKRKDEYPPIEDQLDAIMKWVASEDEITITPELKSIAMVCMSIKEKYPKPKD